MPKLPLCEQNLMMVISPRLQYKEAGTGRRLVKVWCVVQTKFSENYPQSLQTVLLDNFIL